MGGVFLPAISGSVAVQERLQQQLALLQTIEALRDFLAERGVASGIFYPGPLHLQEAYAHLGGNPGDFPEAERACAEVLSLPIVPELSEAQRAHVAATVRAFFE